MQQDKDNANLLTGVAMLAATTMIAQHIAGKATRDALFLTHFEVARLPLMMMASAAISVATVILASRLLNRHGPARLIPLLYVSSALLLALQWYLSDIHPEVAVVALYLHISALNSILISGFWSVINERFDPYTAKRVIAKLAAAATLGGLLGGVATHAVAATADTRTILLMLSGMHLLCAACVSYLGAGQPPRTRDSDLPAKLFAPLQRSALIRRAALLALLVATTAAVLDYILKAEASAALSDEELITFFSYFYVAVGLGSFLVQSAAGDKALRWLGLGGTMAAWPLVILATGVGTLLLRSLATVTLMRASAMLLYNSFFRSGFELLYTPIAPADKRTAKVMIDVGADRSGDLVGGFVVMTILLLPLASETLLLATALALALVCLALIVRLHQDYVDQLASNLRSGKLSTDGLKVVDATTARTIAATQTAIDRDRLLREIADTRASESAKPAPDSGRSFGSLDRVTESIIELRSGDAARIKRVLASQTMTRDLLPHAIALLQDERVLREALRAVRKLASTGAGQMVDALLDPMQHPLVKRRLPLILRHSDSPLAVEGLTCGLEDPDWNVRYRCAQGLAGIRRRQPQLKASAERLLAVAEQESRALSGWCIAMGSPSAKSAISGDGATENDRRVQLLFALFGALYEPEILELCEQSIRSDDPGLRGTALEYLENLLPAALWALLQPVLSPGRIRVGRKRQLQQVARELLAAAKTLRSPRPRNDKDARTPDQVD